MNPQTSTTLSTVIDVAVARVSEIMADHGKSNSHRSPLDASLSHAIADAAHVLSAANTALDEEKRRLFGTHRRLDQTTVRKVLTECVTIARQIDFEVQEIRNDTRNCPEADRWPLVSRLRECDKNVTDVLSHVDLFTSVKTEVKSLHENLKKRTLIDTAKQHMLIKRVVNTLHGDFLRSSGPSKATTHTHTSNGSISGEDSAENVQIESYNETVKSFFSSQKIVIDSLFSSICDQLLSICSAHSPLGDFETWGREVEVVGVVLGMWRFEREEISESGALVTAGSKGFEYECITTLLSTLLSLTPAIYSTISNNLLSSRRSVTITGAMKSDDVISNALATILSGTLQLVTTFDLFRIIPAYFQSGYTLDIRNYGRECGVKEVVAWGLAGIVKDRIER